MEFHQEESQTLIEDVGGKQKRKIVKTNKYYPPDLSSAKYLLIVKFGILGKQKKELNVLKG